ncbi:MAG: DNA-directed RNA polymerase [Candidatus Hadarchaeaceae archaeon]
MAMMMEFCPKCGTVLVPAKVGRCKKLTCPRCGYKGKVKKRSAYRISEKGKEAREVAIIEEKDKKRTVLNEYEIEPPEYDEEAYE